MQFNQCQLYSLEGISQSLTTNNIIWQRKNLIKRMIKRRLNYIFNLFIGIVGLKKKISNNVDANFTKNDLQPGDVVCIKSKEEIQATLNRWNQLKGCAFMEEMWQYCGTEQRVFKLVEKFLDERDYFIKKCDGIVILEGVICEGTKDFGACDRSCFYFWRKEWLEKLTGY